MFLSLAGDTISTPAIFPVLIFPTMNASMVVASFFATLLLVSECLLPTTVCPLLLWVVVVVIVFRLGFSPATSSLLHDFSLPYLLPQVPSVNEGDDIGFIIHCL